MGMISAQTILYEMQEPKLLENEPYLRKTFRVQCPYCGYVHFVLYKSKNIKGFSLLFPKYCGACGREYALMKNQVSLIVEEWSEV